VIATFTRDVEVQQNFPRRYENEDEPVLVTSYAECNDHRKPHDNLPTV